MIVADPAPAAAGPSKPGVILGPADASHFRVKVGRYGDRWYADPLPGDDLAPATDAVWPSISTVKKASGMDWSYVAMKRAAHAPGSELIDIAHMPTERRYDALKSINKHGLDVAAGRGTILHLWGEDMLHGRPPRKLDANALRVLKIPAESLALAERYMPAFIQFFEVYQPELVATEYVTINRELNGVGYGGTPDGMWVIEGDTFAYDFKSRTEDGDHAAYPEEAAQIAAGVWADYMIVEGANGAERRLMPAVTGGMIVSLKPDSVRIYPVDDDRAFEHWAAMHAWWVARRTERDPIGMPWPVKVAAGGVVPVVADTAPAPARAVEQSEPTPDATPLASGVALASRGDVVAALANPEEGHPIADAEFDILKTRFETLPSDARTWFHRIIKESAQAGVPIGARHAKTQRRLYLYRGLIILATEGDETDEIARTYASLAMQSDAPMSPGITVGHAVGALNADEAAAFAELCQQLR